MFKSTNHGISSQIENHNQIKLWQLATAINESLSLNSCTHRAAMLASSSHWCPVWLDSNVNHPIVHCCQRSVRSSVVRHHYFAVTLRDASGVLSNRPSRHHAPADDRIGSASELVERTLPDRLLRVCWSDSWAQRERRRGRTQISRYIRAHSTRLIWLHRIHNVLKWVMQSEVILKLQT